MSIDPRELIRTHIMPFLTAVFIYNSYIIQQITIHSKLRDTIVSDWVEHISGKDTLSPLFPRLP